MKGKKTPGIGNVPLLIFLVIASFGLWFVIPFLKGDFKYHLILSGVTKGHIFPYIAQFVPYQDKKMGGIPQLFTVLESLKAEFGNESYNFFSLGNVISGTADGYFTKGKAVIEALNFLQLDGLLVGNQEFIFGKENLTELSRLANFPFIASNLIEESSGKAPPFVISEKIVSHGGFRIGVIAHTPTFTPNATARENVEGLKFIPLRDTIGHRIAAMRENGVDLTILLSLYNFKKIYPPDWEGIKLARPDIMVCLDFEVEPPPPTFVEGILIKTISGYNQGKELDVLDLVISRTSKKITGFVNRRIPLYTDEIQPNPEVAQKMNSIQEEVSKVKSQVIAEFATDLEKQYFEECPIGDFITDAIRSWFKADIAFQNSGAIKEGIKKGVFTLGDLYQVIPYDNETVCFNLTGADLREIFTAAASLKKGVIQVSGASYAFTHRNSDDFELDEVLVNGRPLDASRSYRVATNEYLANGGDEFTAFKQGKNSISGPFLREIVKSHLQNLGSSGPISIACENRIKVRKSP